MNVHDIIVIGGGHAGVEAAWAAANLGADVALVTLDPSKIGVMSCNPAIGGVAKGQMVREIDALGGLMGLAADATGIMFKVLNTSKGSAVHSPRCQSDNRAYARFIQKSVRERPEITVYAGAADDLLIERVGEEDRCIGVVLSGRESVPASLLNHDLTLRAGAVVLTTGTFMRGLMHTGEQKSEGGRFGELPAVGMSATLHRLGFELGRLKTGTPPRLKRSSLAWDDLPEQWGDQPAQPFSDLTRFEPDWPPLEQVACRITATTEPIHEHIRANIHRAPMFSGQIESIGPRYCPSIEDKVVRFADRSSHHVFLEPESHETETVYCNGIATSLPKDVQDRIVRGMPGCEHAEILMYGYAVEYDMVRPHQILATGMTKRYPGLFLAGQINGTSGYEEAAAQGLIAGVNAVRFARGEGEFVLRRDQAYLGVMMDDLVTKTPVEPYRMFTSRAEYRLLLRSDNAADRLTPLADRLGLICPQRRAVHEARTRAIAFVQQRVDETRIDGAPLGIAMRRPGFTSDDLSRLIGIRSGTMAEANDSPADCVPHGVLQTVAAERHYEGYITRQTAEIKRQSEMESRPVPDWLYGLRIEGLRTEAWNALVRFRPATLGQASRLEGLTPADMTVLLVAIKRGLRTAAVSAAD
ncbi:MAG: tRNA uridine-5-carboxymethylaminomethyl(34) synthesis enzyme MnmG [Phycisphaerales bacterium]